MFSPKITPNDAYEELRNNYAMPLPIPKPCDSVGRTNLHNMTFEEAGETADLQKMVFPTCQP